MLWREIGNKRGIASALNDLGWMAWRQGDYAVAWALSAESLALWQDLGETQGIATALTNLGWIAHHRGDYAAAWALFEESSPCAASWRTRGVAFALMGWGGHAPGRALIVPRSTLRGGHSAVSGRGMKQLLAFCGQPPG